MSRPSRLMVALTVIVLLLPLLHFIATQPDPVALRSEPREVFPTTPVVVLPRAAPVVASRSRLPKPTVGTGHVHPKKQRQERRDGLRWDLLAKCESGGNPRAVSRTGKFRGAYQFMRSTWRSVGGSGDPAAASLAEQTYRAQRLYAQRGTQPWPHCGYLLHRSSP